MTSSSDVSRHPFFDHSGVLALAHRGGASYGPNRGIENSMQAFANAVDLGYRYLETDVRTTADGELLAFHDPTLDRVTDHTGPIAELPYERVRHARIGGREPIPRLVEILDAWPGVRLNIDVKVASAIAPLAEVIEQTGSHERVCLGSFSWRRLRATRARLSPKAANSLAPVEILLLRAGPRWLSRLLLPDAPCVQVPPGYRSLSVITPGFVDTAHELGLQVHAWTIDERAEIENLLDLGVDGIVTDRIDTLRDVLVEREAW